MGLCFFAFVFENDEKKKKREDVKGKMKAKQEKRREGGDKTLPPKGRER